MRQSSRLSVLLAVLLSGMSVIVAAHAQPLRVGGTGGALGLLQVAGDAFTAESGIAVETVPSLGSGGGIRAALDGVLDIAVSGRPLTPDEAKQGLRQVMATLTPYVLATSLEAPTSLTREQVVRQFADPRARWPDGTPVRVILRPASESDYLVLFSAFPGTEAAVAALRHRDDVPVAPTDQDNQSLAETLPGSLIATTFTQWLTERRNLRLVPVDGVLPDLADLDPGRYPFLKRFAFIIGAHPRPAALRFIAFLGSPHGVAALRASGNLVAPD